LNINFLARVALFLLPFAFSLGVVSRIIPPSPHPQLYENYVPAKLQEGQVHPDHVSARPHLCAARDVFPSFLF
jgi:hypothetical protein